MRIKTLLKKFWQRKWLMLFSLGLFGLILYGLINLYILKSSKDSIFEVTIDVPHAQAALILGSRVYADGTMSDVLKDRVIKGLELYEVGKVDKLLVSGDHGQNDYDEVNTIKNYLLNQGVAAKDIFLDHAGFDTYDSLYRAKHIFQVQTLIAVTQEFHLPRAVYIGQALDMEVYGYIADRQPYIHADHYAVRESLARVKAFGNVLFRSKPRYLGEPIAILGDGQMSWD